VQHARSPPEFPFVSVQKGYNEIFESARHALLAVIIAEAACFSMDGLVYEAMR
jgi:hypothetical protein